jgi:hypothetical protein
MGGVVGNIEIVDADVLGAEVGDVGIGDADVPDTGVGDVGTVDADVLDAEVSSARTSAPVAPPTGARSIVAKPNRCATRATLMPFPPARSCTEPTR